ncbi:MAG: PAS domain S-box protein [Thermodesulfobacteriota bacterium]
MSPPVPPAQPEKSRRSVRTLFLLAMALLVGVISLPPLIAGGSLLDALISRFGEEILTEKLDALLTPVDQRYERLRRVGLEDSLQHRQEILAESLAEFHAFRYRESGTVFVIRRDGTILLSMAFASASDPAFPFFFNALTSHQKGLFHYDSSRGARMAAVRYYQPWDSYVGLGIDHRELFAPRTLFFSVYLLILLVVIGIAVLFTVGLQRYLIAPIIRLTDFATRVRHGAGQADPEPADFILELAILRDNLLAMVDDLSEEMEETGRQLAVIQERETELAQAVSRLKESEERYREIFNSPSDAIFIHDAATGAILDINRATVDMYGYSREEAMRLPVDAFSAGIPPYSQIEAGEKINAALHQGPQLFPWLGRRKNGETFWVEVALRLAEFQGKRYVIAVARDIDARKKAEAALLAETERLAVTLRSIADGVITTDTAGRVTLLNPVAERLTGWLQHEAASLPLAQVLRLVDERTGQDASVPTGETCDLILIDRQESQRQVSVSSSPMLDPENHYLGKVIICRDITEKLRTEQELLKIKKLEAVGVLAAGIAHDFNNLLAAILGNLDLAAAQLPDDHRAGQLLREAGRGCLRAKDLTLQLLTFSKGGAPVREIGSIAATVRDSTTFVLRGSPITCDFDIPDDLWLVNADQGQLSQVIQNLALNARQAMPEGGRLSVSCRNLEGRDAAGAPQRRVAIAIRDTGPGMTAAQLERIFEPYYTTRPEGSGLGLTICHAIIAKHEGSIEVSSSPGQGTTFSILLPASDTPLPDPASSHSSPPQSPADRARILIMDDEEMVREIGRGMLEYLGHEVETTADGAEAIAAYQHALASGRGFDLVIMDLTIPGGMGGKEAVTKLRALDPAARVVVSSGYSDDPVMAAYREHGFIGVMAKPFLIEDLSRLLGQTLPPRQKTD